jgi:hypothetical protein
MGAQLSAPLVMYVAMTLGVALLLRFMVFAS